METVPLQDRTAGEMMTRALLTVTADDSMLMAWELMRRGHYHHLPVVTADGHLLGVLDAETIVDHWRPGGPDANRAPVAGLLQGKWKISVTAHDPVSTAAKIMVDSHTDVVAVTEPDGRLVGLLTARDLIAALAGEQPPDEAQRAANAPSLYRIEPVMPLGARHPGESKVPPE